MRRSEGIQLNQARSGVVEHLPGAFDLRWLRRAVLVVGSHKRLDSGHVRLLTSNRPFGYLVDSPPPRDLATEAGRRLGTSDDCVATAVAPLGDAHAAAATLSV